MEGPEIGDNPKESWTTILITGPTPTQQCSVTNGKIYYEHTIVVNINEIMAITTAQELYRGIQRSGR